MHLQVNDDVLTRSFQKYATFAKAKVVKDKRSNKSKGGAGLPAWTVRQPSPLSSGVAVHVAG